MNIGPLKELLLSCIMDKIRINMGAIIVPEIAKWDGQNLTSFPFPCLIIQLCKRYRVPSMPQVDTLIDTITTTDVWHIQNEVDREIKRRKMYLSVHKSPVVNLEELEEMIVELS